MTLTVIEGINSAIGAGTLLAIIVIGFKVSRWSGIVDTRTTNLEGWLKSHIENHPGQSK